MTPPLHTPMPWARFDRWAGGLLMVLAVVAGGLLLLASKTAEPILMAALLVGGLATVTVHVTATYGLAVGRPWARPVAVVLLWFAIASGLFDMAVAFGSGGVSIPLGTIAAAFVLRMRPPERAPWPDRQGRAVALAIAAFIVAVALPRTADGVLVPGNSPFSVSPEAIALSAELDCGATTSGDVAEVELTATWRWTEREVLPRDVDALVFHWWTSDPASDDPMSVNAFGLRDAPGTGFTITGEDQVRPGRESSTGSFWLGPEGPGSARDVVRGVLNVLGAGDALVDDVASGREGRAEAVMIDIDRQRLRDDTYRITLASDGDTRLRGMLSADVGYIHGGRWIVWSDPAASCAW